MSVLMDRGSPCADVGGGGAIFSMGGIILDFPTCDLEDASPPKSPLFNKPSSPEPEKRVSPNRLQRMESIAEEKNNGEPIEVTVVQLLPDFDGELDDLIFDEPISYTTEELSNLQTDVKVEECIGTSLLLEDPSLASAGFLPPCVLQRIVDSSDSIDSLNPDTAKKAFHPVLLNRGSASLSVTSEGFIQLNDYKISFDFMGGGRLSEVRVALNEKDNCQYAVKILSKKEAAELQLTVEVKYGMMRNSGSKQRTSRNPLEEAYREINILQRLDHPNVISLVEVIDQPEDDNIYIVFELLDQPLMDLPTDKPFSESTARRHFREIVCGVEHLHENRVVHRDLKPDNMLLSKDGVVKISDFGFCEELPAAESEPDSPESESELPSYAEVSAVSGTPAFTAPECLRQKNKPVCGRSLDLWSLGITLYALVFGDVPFKADSMPALFYTITHDTVQYPPSPRISDDLKDLINRLLEKNPKHRITMEQVKQHAWLTEDLPVDGKCPDTLAATFEKDLVLGQKSSLKQA